MLYFNGAFSWSFLYRVSVVFFKSTLTKTLKYLIHRKSKSCQMKRIDDSYSEMEYKNDLNRMMHDYYDMKYFYYKHSIME